VTSPAPCIFSRVIGVFALVVLGLSLSAGQEPPKTAASDLGAINGTATDQTQAVIADARVTLTSAAGEKLETQVNDKGVYSFTGLKPGVYTLTVSAPNFAAKTFDSITLAAGLELALDAALKPARAKAAE